MSKAKSMIFVCLGNICRSPIAEGIAKRYAQEKNLELTIDSAGTGNWHVGESPCSDAIKICNEHNLDISEQKSREVQKEDFTKFDLVIGLDKSNMRKLESLGCKNAIKLGTFGYEGEDVPDPYFFDGYEGFDKVYKMIDICVKRLIDERC